MITEIQIPLKVLLESPSKKVDLLEPARCSRCNVEPAPFFEAHLLKYRAGLIRHRTITRKFDTIISFQLRLPLCENCYRMNFIEAPETMTADRNPLGTTARRRKFGIVAATLVTGAAFILLMKVIPLPASLPAMQNLWLYLIALAIVIYSITFGLTEVKNRELRKGLLADNYDLKLHRADAEVEMQIENPVPTDIAVSLAMENDTWANECAKIYGWKTQIEGNPPEKDDVQ